MVVSGVHGRPDRGGGVRDRRVAVFADVERDT
jgi:hypothetical protein